MHRLAVLLALTACYRPGSEVPCTVTCSAAAMDCPAGLTCNLTMGRCALGNGGCVPDDASDDARIVDASDGPVIDAPSDGPPIDGAIPALCIPSATFTTFGLTQGYWFTPDLDRSPTIAVKYLSGELQVTEGNANTTTPGDYGPLIPTVPSETYDRPRLAPSRDEVFYLHEDMTGGIKSLRRATRLSPGTWSTTIIFLKEENGVTPISINGDEDIGAPTTTTPRHMLLSTTTYLDEFVESGPTQWTRLRRHSISFAGPTFLGRATLNEDGRRMVFKGHDPPANVAGFYSDRPALGDLFGIVATPIPAPASDSVETPYLSEDCRDYYYTFPTSGQIFHVVLP